MMYVVIVFWYCV